jgi:hypothetical protein
MSDIQTMKIEVRKTHANCLPAFDAALNARLYRRPENPAGAFPHPPLRQDNLRVRSTLTRTGQSLKNS